MVMRILPMSAAEAARGAAPGEQAGFGALQTPDGNLPLERLDVRADLVGLASRVEVTQEFRNVNDRPIEATYIFPLPDRSAVTGLRMAVADRVVLASLAERGAARRAYDEAIAAGQRASIAEEERPDVFTLRVGNILPGERISVTMTLAGVLAVEDGEATFR
ncbi:MAG: trypsin, partial [Micromonosporaceae bacterium]|nr:trypsin [Micromonosporaceae bacterium]